MVHNILSIKNLPAVASDVEKALHHAHHQGLSETARSGKQSNLVACFSSKLIYQLSLIHEISVLMNDFLVAFTANTQFVFHVLRPLQKLFYGCVQPLQLSFSIYGSDVRT